MSAIYRVYLFNGVTEVFEGKDIPKLIELFKDTDPCVTCTEGDHQFYNWDELDELWLHPLEKEHDVFIAPSVIPFLDGLCPELKNKILQMEKIRNALYVNKGNDLLPSLIKEYHTFLSQYQNGEISSFVPVQIIEHYKKEIISMTRYLRKQQEKSC